MTCTALRTVTQAEMDAGGDLVNIGIADSNETDAVEDPHSIPIEIDAALTIDKTSTTTLVTAAGQVVDYSYLVTNTGNVTLTGVTVTDVTVDAPGVSCPTDTLTVAPDPGSSMTCTALRTVMASASTN